MQSTREEYPAAPATIDDLLRDEIALAADVDAGIAHAVADLQGSRSVDLQTLLGEMAALKSEVRKETQASQDVRLLLAEQAQSLRLQLDRSAHREAQQRDDLHQAREMAVEATARGLIDIADRITSSLQTAEAAIGRSARGRLPWRWFGFRGGGHDRRALEALRDGLRLTDRRTHEHLAELGVSRIRVQGQAFDPNTMRAVDTITADDIPPGDVAQEVMAGYRWGETVLRPADVVVAVAVAVAAPRQHTGRGAADADSA